MDVELFAADGSTELGVIDVYESASIEARFNDVSTWEMTLPTKAAIADLLLNAYRPRVVIRIAGVTFRSGPMIRVEREVSLDGDLLTLAGTDDLVWLRRRLAHPQPSKATPPYNGQAYDTRTGAASVVMAGFVDANAGPAAVAGRRVEGRTVPPPAALGPTVTVSARYQNLLDLITRTAARAKLGVEIRDLAFTVFQPAGPSSVFSVDLGTLAGWIEAKEAPEINYVYVAGGGRGTARIVREYTDAASRDEWGRFEGFDDRRDTTATAELNEAGEEVLAEIPTPELQLEVLDTPSQMFLRDWQLGDKATVRLDDRTITDVIRSVTITLEPNAPPMVSPIIGGQV